MSKQRLLALRMAQLAIPDGGGFVDGLKFFTDTALRHKIANEAEAWVTAALEAIRQADDPNPWRDASDEAIAAELLRRFDERKVEHGGH